MTQAEKLEALIQKAIDGGWDNAPPLLNGFSYLPWEKKVEVDCFEMYDERPVACFLFNKDFARALFGEELIEIDRMYTEMGNKFPVKQPAMDYHLQQAVISEDPIDYMYKVVFG